ncbi:MAG TPA: patatin-like phospholipase family protein [Myxococcales bacterium]|nr:patatin-like phospholipase family protein [Myxococcales bacterium]
MKLAWAQSNNSEEPRRSLVLAGGGMRVAYQAGVLQAIWEAGLRFFHADGTSGGTMNLAMLMSGLTPAEMCERWRTLNQHDFVSFMPLKEYLRGPNVKAMGSATGVMERVFPHLGIDIGKINAATGVAATFNVCNFARKTNEAIPNDKLTLDYLTAGISLPILMPAVNIGGAPHCDSVWIKDANVLEAVRRGAEEIWLVWCIGNTAEYIDGPFPQYVHMIEMSANGKLFAELEQVAELNERIARGDSPYGQRRPIRLQVVKPEYALPLDPDYYLGRIDGATLVAMGYADGHASCERAAAHPESKALLTPAATQMKLSGPGISFRQRLEGLLDGKPLRLEASVVIQDLERFLRDPNHAGVVNATLDLPGFGERILCMRGRVTAADAESALRYRLPFVHQGIDYLLEGTGRKAAEGETDLGMIAVRLFRGTELLGVAEVRMSATALVEAIASMHAIHANSAAVAVETVTKFGRFLFARAFARHRKSWWQFWK